MEAATADLCVASAATGRLEGSFNEAIQPRISRTDGLIMPAQLDEVNNAS